VRKLADATKACRMRRTRGETGPWRRLTLDTRPCAEVWAFVLAPTGFLGEAGLASGLSGLV